MAGKIKKSTALGFGQLIKVILLLVLIGGAALGYVWQKNQIDRLSAQRRDLENSLNRIRHDNDGLRRQISDLYEPVKLMRRVNEMKLGLVSRQEIQVVRLTEPREVTPESNNNFSHQLTRRSVGELVP